MRLCSFWRLEARIICSVFPASRGCPPFLGSGPRIILPSHLPLELCLSCLLLFFFYYYYHLFTFGCVGSSFLCEGFL